MTWHIRRIENNYAWSCLYRLIHREGERERECVARMGFIYRIRAFSCMTMEARWWYIGQNPNAGQWRAHGTTKCQPACCAQGAWVWVHKITHQWMIWKWSERNTLMNSMLGASARSPSQRPLRNRIRCGAHMLSWNLTLKSARFDRNMFIHFQCLPMASEPIPRKRFVNVCWECNMQYMNKFPKFEQPNKIHDFT